MWQAFLYHRWHFLCTVFELKRMTQELKCHYVVLTNVQHDAFEIDSRHHSDYSKVAKMFVGKSSKRQMQKIEVVGRCHIGSRLHLSSRNQQFLGVVITKWREIKVTNETIPRPQNKSYPAMSSTTQRNTPRTSRESKIHQKLVIC